jgi:hypothetical protein
MAMTEAQRHELYVRLEEAIGMGAATTLMEGMPPVGWADVATKRDLEHLEARLDARLEARLDVITAELGTTKAELTASLERSLREQSNRFLVGMAAMLSLLLAVQEVLARV